MRREAFERRERGRIDAARRRFENEVKKSQAFLERWGKEESEPKTAAERAFRVLVKMLEFLDEVSTAWNEAHESFNKVLIKRLNYEKEGIGTAQQYELIDTEIVRVHNELKTLDKDLFDAVVGWHSDLASMIDMFDWKNPASVVKTILSMVGLIIPAMVEAGKLRERARAISMSTNMLDMQVRMMAPPLLRSPTATMSEAK